jgi:murein DD-endopeptidase MepM/ murein hydrolase activator NlpD
MTGELIQASWTDDSGGVVTVTSTVSGTKYSVTYIHMSQEAVSAMGARLNKTLNRGEAVGKTYSAVTQDFDGNGVASPGELPKSSGTHLHYGIYVNSSLVDPLNYTPAKLSLHDTIVSPGGC